MRGVCGHVVLTKIRFCLHNPACGRTMDEDFAEQVASHFHGRSFVEQTVQNTGRGQDVC